MEIECASDETGHNTLLMQGATPAAILWKTIVPWQPLVDQGRWRIGNS
jgi:hypothetical protein